MANERGSIYAHTDEAGAIIQINTYDEYGRPGNSNQGRFGYTGQIWLAEAGLYHYKARAYHAELGVFMQSDPIGHSGGVNLYAYVGGDPVNATDPWGLKPEEKGPCTGTRIPRTRAQCNLMLGGTGRRLPSFGGGGNFGGGGGGSMSCSGDLNDDTCTVTPSRTKSWPWSPRRYPSDLIGSVVHRMVPSLDAYDYFRSNNPTEFEFAVAVLGVIPFENTAQALEALRVANTAFQRFDKNKIGGGLAIEAMMPSLNLFSMIPNLGAYVDISNLSDSLGNIRMIGDLGDESFFGFMYLDWQLSCTMLGASYESTKRLFENPSGAC